MEPSSCEDNNSSSSVNPDEERRSTMVRRVLPKEEEEGNSPPLHSVLPVRSNKRRCVSSACIPCRKRKSKCDGGSPGCSTCLAVYHTDCAYDFDGDHRRKGALKRDIEQLKEKNDSLDVIIATIRSASESEVGDIVNHIRQHGGLPADIATSIKENRPLSDGPLAPSLEADLSEMVEKFRVSGGGELKFLGYGPSWSDENLGPRESRSTSGSWTKVTSDIGFISDLLSLYFTWNHPCYVLFSKSCFLADMSRGRKKYCSSLLVNAILALACHFSDRPEARADPDDPASTGEHFFREAKRILAVEGEASSLTSVQALALMSLHEAGCGRDSSGWMYSGRAFRMGLDMDFNLPLARLDLSPTEIEVRKITFWGCFTIDKMWSLFSGRIPLLPSTSIGIDKPVIFPSIESEPWTPYSNRAVSDEPPQACRVQAIASRFCEVSEILGDVLPMLFAPKEPVTLTKLNTLYTRLKTWRGQLPIDMEAKNEALPSILGLHIYYHATLLLLLRPFFKKEILVHGETPREICRRAANDIISLTTQYRKSYSLRHTVIQVPQVLLGASVILLMDLPSPSPSHAVPSNLVRSLKDLKELAGTWQWCNLTLRHIGELAEKWNIDLPKDIWNVISSTPTNPKPPSNHEIVNATHVNHEYSNQHYHYGRPRSENPSDVMGNQSGNSGWGMLNDEDFQFVNSMISFPSVIDDWTCIGAPV